MQDPDSSSYKPEQQDEQQAKSPENNKVPQNFMLSPEAKSYLSLYLSRVKAVLLSPRHFFATMPTSGGYVEPGCFFAISCGISSLISALLKFNILEGFWSFLAALVGTAVVTLVAYFLAQALGGKGTLEATLRVFAYSGAIQLTYWLGPIAMLGVLYSFFLNYWGLRRVHELSGVKTCVVVFLAGILSTLIFGVVALSLFLRSVLHF